MFLVCARNYEAYNLYRGQKCKEGYKREDFRYLSKSNNIRGLKGPNVSIVLCYKWYENIGPYEAEEIFDYAQAHDISIVKDNKEF